MFGIRKGSKLGRPYSSRGLSNWMMALWMAIDKHSSKSAFLLSHFLNDGAATRNVRAFSEGEQYSRKDKELQNLIKAKTPKTSKVFILGATETLKNKCVQLYLYAWQAKKTRNYFANLFRTGPFFEDNTKPDWCDG
jgi:hypothetical protein